MRLTITSDDFSSIFQVTFLMYLWGSNRISWQIGFNCPCFYLNPWLMRSLFQQSVCSAIFLLLMDYLHSGVSLQEPFEANLFTLWSSVKSRTYNQSTSFICPPPFTPNHSMLKAEEVKLSCMKWHAIKDCCHTNYMKGPMSVDCKILIELVFSTF